MYLYGIYAVALSALLATAWLQLTTAMAVSAAKHVALRYATAALERAQDELIDSVAAQVSSGGTATPLNAPAPRPPQPACTAPCSLLVATQIELAGQTAAAAGGGAIAANLQQHRGVAEGRVAAIVSSTVTNGAGGVLARATRRMTLRTFAVEPYVALASADEAVAGNSSVADFAGSCDGAACGTDNRIHALLRCDDPVAPQNCAGRPYRSADAFASSAWRNANAVSDGWSR